MDWPIIIRWCFIVVPVSLDSVNRRDSLLAALVATVWGFNFVVIDWGMKDVPPLLFAAIRFTLVVFPAVLLVRRPAARWRTVAAVGAFMSLGQFGLLYVSMDAGMPPGLAALVLQAQVIFTVVIAAGALRERPTRPQAVGVALGSIGLVVVAVGRGGHVPLGALVLCLLAALSWGIGNVVSRASGVTGGLSLTVWSAAVVPVPLFALSLVLDGPATVGTALASLSWQAIVSTAYTAGLASLVGYALFNGLLSRNPSSAVVPWVLLAPVVAMASAWALLGQRPTTGELVGGAVLVIGVLVAMRRSRGAPSRQAAVGDLDLGGEDAPFLGGSPVVGQEVGGAAQEQGAAVRAT
ncbi:EamA family transporter [Marmoricola sp. URHB0036]|uniref:EamA family transporter n=1 Tax=Marmoricola sp. URHB0036 TaxID=1298863 RepID=UPI001E57CC6A|nr:EamA family transporter [Marmoricola sp. URHB0036]